MHANPVYLGLNIGGTQCSAIVGDAAGQILEKTSWPSLADLGPKAMLLMLIEKATALQSKFDAIVSAGVAIGGPLDSQRGIILSPPNLPGWDNIPLKDRLSEALKIPVFVEHDASACALAEYRWGFEDHSEKVKPSRLVYLTCGTGFGAGIVFDGKIFRGGKGRNPEFGHARYRPEGPVAFGKQGSYEAYCSGSGLPKLAAWKCPERWSTQPPDGKELVKLANQDDVDAKAVLKINAQAVGDACALLADLLVPDIILLGSLARYLGAAWLDQVLDRFASETQASNRNVCTVESARLEERLQDCSALVVAMQDQ